MNTFIMQTDLESEVGKYGAFWIYHIMYTNRTLYESLTEHAIFKMAQEVNNRVYQLIEQIVQTVLPNKTYLDQQAQAEYLALNEIIYHG